MVPKTSPGDARVLILAWTDGLGRATAEYVGLAALFPFSVRFSLIHRERASARGCPVLKSLPVWKTRLC